MIPERTLLESPFPSICPGITKTSSEQRIFKRSDRKSFLIMLCLESLDCCLSVCYCFIRVRNDIVLSFRFCIYVLSQYGRYLIICQRRNARQDISSQTTRNKDHRRSLWHILRL